MKLRNNQSGEIKTVIHAKILVHFSDGTTNAFNSIKQLTDMYGDYTEPLIKDEKIRKAVRAWAEAYEIVAVRHIVLSVDKTKHSVLETGYGSDYSAITLETELDLTDGKTYTIAELCGEEKE